MKFKTKLVKLAINLTPNGLIKWVANMVLKGIAEISDFHFDLDTRSVNICLTLCGETEAIEVVVDGFAVVGQEDIHQFVILEAQSNRLWINNILSRIVGKKWDIPEIPEHRALLELIADLLKPQPSEQEAPTSEEN